MQFYKRSPVGIMVPAAEGTEHEHDWIEVRLDEYEYRKLLQKLRDAKQAVIDAQYDAEKRERAAYSDMYARFKQSKEHICQAYNKRIDQLETEKQIAVDRIMELETEKKELEKEIENQRNLNVNLKRIAKERANSNRGISPKKERTGFVILCSAQYRESFHDSADSERRSAIVWKTVFQTPYAACLPYNQVKEDIWKELIHDILPSCGYQIIQSREKNGIYQLWYDDTQSEICGIYRWDYSANFRAGYWEIILYHTQPIEVPEEFRLPQ